MILEQTNVPNFGLERMRHLLALRGNPHERVSVIHIGGTNGKGSTIQFLSALLQQLGVKVGVFCSPYVTDMTEQVVIDGKAIDTATFQQYRLDYQQLVDDDSQCRLAGTTGFEVLTAIAFEYFATQEVDVAIMEVGMGGLGDSTNVCESVLTGLTTVGFDHVEWLGDTLEAITTVKAGIMKPNVPIVLGQLPEESVNIVQAKSLLMHSTVVQYQVDYVSQWQASLPLAEQFIFANQWRQEAVYAIPLLGKHQVDNASMALQLADMWCHQQERPLLTPHAVQRAFDSVTWQARLEVINDAPLIILDGAHNEHAMARLVETLNERYADKTKCLIFGCIYTKDMNAMLAQLQKVEQLTIQLTTFDDERSMTQEALQHYANQWQLEVVEWQEALMHYKANPQYDVLLLTGSLYFMSQVKKSI